MAVVLLFLSAAANSEAHCQYLSTRQRGRDFPIPLLTLTFLQNISFSGLQPLCAQLYLYTVPCPGEPKAGPSLGPVHAEPRGRTISLNLLAVLLLLQPGLELDLAPGRAHCWLRLSFL